MSVDLLEKGQKNTPKYEYSSTYKYFPRQKNKIERKAPCLTRRGSSDIRAQGPFIRALTVISLALLPVIYLTTGTSARGDREYFAG